MTTCFAMILTPMRSRSLFALPLLLSAALAGCGDGDAASDADAVLVDTAEGVERLTWAEQTGSPLGWGVDTLLAIGDAMGAEEYTFGSISATSLAGSPDGHVFVLDRQGGRLLEYGPDGAHVATYGRKGGGPGEFSFPLSVALGPGDTLWTTDLMSRRITGFPRDGGEPRIVPYPDAGSFPSSELGVVEDGFLQVVRGIGSPEEDEERPPRLIRFTRELQPLDTLRVAPEAPRDVVQLEMEGRSMIMAMSQQFWPAFQWDVLSDGGIVVSESPDYELRILNPDGSLRRIVRRDPAARVATEEDRERVRQGVLAEADSGGGITIGGSGPDAAAQRRMAEQRVESMTFADRIPRIHQLAVDPAGRIWVGVAADTAPDELERIDLYDSAGQLLGELHDVPFPAAFTGTNRILTTRKDEMDVPQVLVLRVEGMGSGAIEPPEVAAGSREVGQ